jgi:iron(III) transport system ATP-binding protein
VASVELRGLTKRYGTNAVVDDVSLRIEHGLLVCLLGPSGCGKTTTLRLIAGFVEPSGGEIVVGERVVSSPARTLPPEQRNMSMIFQSYALWPHMTVTENVAYGLKLRRLDRAVIAQKVAAILAVTKLEALAERYPGELSGGQQQRVALARALIVDPETLLLDEPLSNLDANLREEMRFEVRRLHDEYRYTTGLRDARPVRGDDHRRPDRRDEPRQDRAGRNAGGDLQPPALGICRALHRVE